MKNKLFVLFAAVLMISVALTISASAFEFRSPSYSETIFSSPPTATAAENLYSILDHQLEINPLGRAAEMQVLYVVQSTNGFTVNAVIGRLEDSVTSISVSGDILTFNFGATYVYVYDSSFGFYESATTPAAKRTIDSKCIIYSTENIPATSIPAFVGFNTNFTTGNSDFNTPEIHTYWQTMYEYITGYESMVQQKNEEIQDSFEAGEQAGYEVGLDQGYDVGYEAGYQTGSDDTHDTAYTSGFMDGKTEGFTQGYNTGLNKGKTECEKTHLALQEQAYGDGYDMGQEECEKTHANIIDVAYHNGQYDCQQTHETLMREQYEEGWGAGHTAGVTDGYDTGYDEGYDNGYLNAKAEWYPKGYDEGMRDSEKLTDEWLQKKYQQGFTDGEQSVLETSKVVTDYVDSLFSAPLNFLYTMLDIEVFGINVFGIAAAVLALAVVLVVVKIILKVKG